MKYQEKCEITVELLENDHSMVDRIFREMALRTVHAVPMDDLKRLFHFDRFDPFSKENEDKLKSWETPDWEKQKIMHYRERHLNLLTASITI